MPLKHINRYTDRHGTRRYYYRPPGAKNTPLSGEPGSVEFMASYEAAVAGKEPIGASRNPSGSVAQAVALYLESATFARLAPDTRRGRKSELERFREAKGDKPIARMERRHIEKHLRNKTPVSARNCLKALSPWLDWCVAEDLIATNPAADIERPRSANKEGYAPWDDDLVELYRARHPIGTKARTTLEVFVNVGAARVDTAPLGRQHVRNGMLVYRRSKTKVLVEIPILPDLQTIIDELPPSQLSFIAKQDGTAYATGSLDILFRRWCREAGIPKGYSSHGLRKYAANVRADLGATNAQLKAWFGWTDDREPSHYTRGADRRKAAQQLGRMMNAAFPTRKSS